MREGIFLFLEDLILLLSVKGFCVPHGLYFHTVQKSLQGGKVKLPA